MGGLLPYLRPLYGNNVTIVFVPKLGEVSIRSAIVTTDSSI